MIMKKYETLGMAIKFPYYILLPPQYGTQAVGGHPGLHEWVGHRCRTDGGWAGPAAARGQA